MTTAVRMNVANAVKRINAYTHNRELSLRLLYNTRAMNKNRSLEWCADLVVQQLIRDRR